MWSGRGGNGAGGSFAGAAAVPVRPGRCQLSRGRARVRKVGRAGAVHLGGESGGARVSPRR